VKKVHDENQRQKCVVSPGELDENDRGEAQKQEQRARKLDEEAAQKREQIREDFRLAMSARRAEAMRALAELRNVALDEAERIIAEAKVLSARTE
jgi:hypothetical protein